MAGHDHFDINCPTRLLFDQIADKWSMMVLTVLDPGPMRFNAIKRHMEGVTQKALTQCLRRLERNGLILRRVLPASPVAVEYEVTALGRSLHVPFKALYGWMIEHMEQVDAARQRFEEQRSIGEGESPARDGDGGNIATASIAEKRSPILGLAMETQ